MPHWYLTRGGTLPAGVDPQSRAANWVLDVFTPAGRLSWQDQGAAAPTVLEPGQLATMVDTGAPTFKPLPQPPDWLDVRTEPLINQAASKQLEPLLDPDAAVGRLAARTSEQPAGGGPYAGHSQPEHV